MLGPLTYQLQLPPQWKIHDVFHTTLLIPYHETKAHGPNFAYPPPDTVEGEEQWKVKVITQHKKYRRKVKGKLQHYKFLIKWEGYPTSTSSWKLEENLEGTQEILTKYPHLLPTSHLHTQLSTRNSPPANMSDCTQSIEDELFLSPHSIETLGLRVTYLPTDWFLNYVHQVCNNRLLCSTLIALC